jgi:formylglycine-generating enzyme required for sulfatase activity
VSDDAGNATGEFDPASMSGMRLDKYLVTVGRFRQFVNALNPVQLEDGGVTVSWLPPAGSGKHTHLNGGLGLASGPNVDAGQMYEPGWSGSAEDNAAIAPTDSNLSSCSPATWTPAGSPPSQENLPINCVTWQEAYAFCIWDGAFLPSESEWEYAAAGGQQQLEFPWGPVPPGPNCPGAGCYAIYDCDYPNGPACLDTVANVAPVGFAATGAGRWGQLDLAGELWEWNLDLGVSIYADPCVDCVQLDASSSVRVIRGGMWHDGTPDGSTAVLHPWYRDSNAPTGRSASTGFRCARAP